MKYLAGLMAIMGLTSMGYAYETRTLVGLWPSMTSSVVNFRSYHNVGLGNSQLIVGFSTGLDKSNIFSPFVARVGLTMKTELPLLSDFDLIAEVSRLGSSNLEFNSINIVRNYVYPLSNSVELGVSVTLARLGFLGSTRFDILSSVEPVLGVKVKL